MPTVFQHDWLWRYLCGKPKKLHILINSTELSLFFFFACFSVLDLTTVWCLGFEISVYIFPSLCHHHQVNYICHLITPNYLGFLDSSLSGKSKTSRTAVAIAVPVVALVLLLILIIFIYLRVRKPRDEHIASKSTLVFFLWFVNYMWSYK